MQGASWRWPSQPQSWEASWQDDWSGGKGKKGTKKGKGKRPAAQSQEGDEGPGEHTGRILARYQLAHKLLRTAAGEDGSAFVKADKQKLNDFAMLQARNLKKLVSNENHHLMRRPGVGISEAAGSLQAAAAVVQSMKNLDLKPVEKLLSDKNVVEALQMLNTMDGSQTRDTKKIEKALRAVETAVQTGGKELEESMIKCTIMASRLYLLGVHGLPLAAALFGRHVAAGGSDDSAAAKPRKKKTKDESDDSSETKAKAKKAKKRDRKKHSTSSTSKSSGKKAKKAKKDRHGKKKGKKASSSAKSDSPGAADGRKAKPANKETDGQEPAIAEAQAKAFKKWQLSEIQSSQEEWATYTPVLRSGTFSKETFEHHLNLLPAKVREVFDIADEVPDTQEKIEAVVEKVTAAHAAGIVHLLKQFARVTLSRSFQDLRTMEGRAQRFVRSLRAEGLSDEEVRNQMKLYGYKAGRINELMEQTARMQEPVGQENFLQELEAELDKLEPEEVMAEWAAEERGNEEICAGPGILEPAGLPRLRGKQAPTGGWEHVFIPPWAVMVLEELAEAEAAAEEAGAAVDEGITDEGPTEPEERPKKKPAAADKETKKRARNASELCPGKSRQEPCIFSQRSATLGKPAMLGSGKAKCQFCDTTALPEAAKNPQRRKHITRALRSWVDAGRQDIADAALARLPEDVQEALKKALARPSRATAAVAARNTAAAQAKEDARKKALEHRQYFGEQPSQENQRIYNKKMADDKRRVRSKFKAWAEAAEEGDDTWRSPLATRFEKWCKEASWVACEKCHRLERVPLRETHISGRRSSATTVKMCRHCKDGVGYPTVAHGDIPVELRHLSSDALWAVRPLEPDVGAPAWAKHGYRVHTDMIRFWWRPRPVHEQIQMLEKEEDKAAATKAYKYLMGNVDSSYRKFVEMHGKFLRRHQQVLEGEWDRKLLLPRRALEEEGLECAVWPHLYPRTNMCETFIRQQDSRRKDRAAATRRAQPAPGPTGSTDSSSDSQSRSSSSSTSESSSKVCEGAKKPPPEEDEEDQDVPAAEDAETEDEMEDVAPLNFARAGRNSAKSAYLAKVLGPVLGYGATYELFQFVYDLWLWSTLGAKKNAVETPMRLAMAGYSFSPEYWHTRHAALVDTVKQLGLPTMFITVAPYEWSFPFHEWIEDEAQKMLRSRLHLPVAETLHIAHVLAQTVVGLLTGANKQTQQQGEKKPWISHIFGSKDDSGKKTVLNFFGRLEYQDGKRKRYVNLQEAATQFYHGRGTVHLHLLVWLQHLEAVKLEDSVSATVPADNEVMASLVEGSQRSWTGSGWPKEEGPSRYEESTGLLRLHHSEADFCTYRADGTPEGIRAYLTDILASLRCHVDVQMSDGRGMLLKYVSGYVPKFSDSFTTDWLCDQGSDYAIAKRVLTDYHPLVPEMTLQLAMQWFPQCFAGGSLQRFRVPVPWEGDMPERVKQYMTSKWRAEDMTLAEFLRKTNQKTGNIHRYLQLKYQRARKEAEGAGAELMHETLEEYANEVKSMGEVALAAMYLSRYNDKYYGQWVLMNVPFKDPNRDLKRPELELVPDHLYYQALAYLHRPDHWTNQAAIREELELEGFRDHHIRNITAMIAANQVLIVKYLDGALDKNVEEPAEEDEGQEEPQQMAGPVLAREQQQIAEEIVKSVKAGVLQRQQEENAWKGEGPDDEEGASPFAAAAPLRPALAVLGPAGSGKSTAVHQAIREAVTHQCRILLAAPTGRLAATLRERFPHLEVDTVHGAFLVYKPVHETLELLLTYDLIVVEEVGQLSRAMFERIMEQWSAAERLPTLVFVGDFYQLPGVEPTSALHSPLWHNVMVKKRELHTMRRCKCPKLRRCLEILRTNKPSKQQLKEIKAGHKAPSVGRAGYCMNKIPSSDDVEHILAETPSTLFLTISRRACAYLNDLAVHVIFPDCVPLAVVPADPESNVKNFYKGHMIAEEPLEIPVFAGAKVILTKNLNKAIGFVNGMAGTVVAMEKNNVMVRTEQGRLLAIHPWTSESGVVHYPFRLGYASTLHKVQGATLKHVTIWLDVPNMPAAGYVALSRVERDSHWRFVGDPTVHHFTPARFNGPAIE
eukprot:Skav236123  [mRNA]  locus=scaffold900:1522:8592:- [translate_table: standard]